MCIVFVSNAHYFLILNIFLYIRNIEFIMLDYKILNKKPRISNEDDNDLYIDLLTPTFVNQKIIHGQLIAVNQYYVARPDLISLAMYGDDRFADIICKVNGISNPFELNENDILFIPEPSEITNLTTNVDKPSELVTDENKNLFKQNKVDNRKKVSDKRSSNEMIFGQSNYIIDKSAGLVFY